MIRIPPKLPLELGKRIVMFLIEILILNKLSKKK